MQILNKNDNYDEVYNGIIRKTYDCSIFDETFKENILPVDEFIQLCLENSSKKCLTRQIIDDLQIEIKEDYFSNSFMKITKDQSLFYLGIYNTE